MMIIARIVFYGIAAILLGVAGFTAHRTRLWLAEAERAPGSVVDLVVHRGTGDGVTYAPAGAFEAPDGCRIRFTSRIRSYPAPYARDETVTVLFRAGAPEEAAIESF